MMVPLTTSIRQVIQRHEMVRPGDRVAVAVSGGADSVALLRLLEDLRGEVGFTLCVIHFNHQLRGHDSDEDERFVASLARERRLEFFCGAGDVTTAACRHKWNVEDAARRLRYEFFARVIADGTAIRVATAHTADDQAETVLARLIRGTGLTGLSAIHPVRGNIIRPLIAVRRESLRRYLGVIKQEWREDSTNTDVRRLRARVRLQLLPQIERDFCASIVGNLSNLAALARDDEFFWNALIEAQYTSVVVHTAGKKSIHARDLLCWPVGSVQLTQAGIRKSFRALTQRVIRRLYADLAFKGGELSREHVEQIIRLAEKGASGRRLELPGGVRVYKDFDRLVFTDATASPSKTPRTYSPSVSYSHEVDIPVQGFTYVSVPELGRRFQVKVIDWPSRERETNREGVVLDAERLRYPLVMRNWAPGDSYCPSGRQRRQRLARILMARHVSAAQRGLWPVLTSAGRVAWVYRMPVAKEFSASETTRRGVWIVEDRR